MQGLRCQQCGDIVLKHSVAETKVRNRILLIKSDGVFAVCRGCGSEVGIPLQVDEPMLKALPVIHNPKLFIK